MTTNPELEEDVTAFHMMQNWQLKNDQNSWISKNSNNRQGYI
jgi:hypothetical protein